LVERHRVSSRIGRVLGGENDGTAFEVRVYHPYAASNREVCGKSWRSFNRRRTVETIDLMQKFARFDEVYVPKIVAELNGQYVKLARIQGPYVWHRHENEDELFLVVRGTLRIEFRDRTETLTQGQLIVVPKGVEHRPDADDEALVLLFEPKATINTGNVVHDYTKTELDWV
jgi:mannose-6-phosphate isomerase-like protein (cupin superfamily)